MRIQISYADETQRVWETQGVPAGRESVPTAYGVEWDLQLRPSKDGTRVALIIKTTASSARGTEAPEDSPERNEALRGPSERAGTAKNVAERMSKTGDDRAEDTDVKILVAVKREGREIDTVSALLDAVEERGGVTRMVIDGEVVYPPMDDGIE